MGGPRGGCPVQHTIRCPISVRGQYVRAPVQDPGLGTPHRWVAGTAFPCFAYDNTTAPHCIPRRYDPYIPVSGHPLGAVCLYASCRLPARLGDIALGVGPNAGYTLTPCSSLHAGPLPPTPPPRVAAALKGGLLPCLETLLRRAATEPNGPHSRLIVEAFRGPKSAWPYLGWLLSYGDARRGASLVATLRKLPAQLDGQVNGVVTASLSFQGTPLPTQSLVNSSDVVSDVLIGAAEVLFGVDGRASWTSIYAQEEGVAAVQAGRPRLQLLSAYAVCQLLPPLADYARAATCRALGLVDKSLGGAAKANVRASLAAAMQQLRVFHSWGCVCRCLSAFAATSLGDRAVAGAATGAGGSGSSGSSGSGSSAGGGGGGGGGGVAMQAVAGAAAGAGSSGSSSSAGGGGGAGGGGDGSGGSAAAGAANGSRYRYPWCEELFKELGVVELLGTALRLFAAVTPRGSAEVRHVAAALVAVAAAMPDKLQHAAAAARSGAAAAAVGQASGGSKRPATAGKAKSKAAAPAGGRETGTWPPELVRELGDALEMPKNEAIAKALKPLADLLELWGQGSGAKVEAGAVERGEELLGELRAAVMRAFGLVERGARSEVGTGAAVGVGAGVEGWSGESLREVRGLLRTCSNPRCANLDGDSEAAVEGGLVACVHGCGLARYCGKVCMAAHRKAGHAAVCAVGVAGSGGRK